MACFKPLQAWYTALGEVVWVERGDIVRTLSLPCGQCIGCRLERSRQWAIRVMHEAQSWEDSCFVTLTYDDLHVSVEKSLEYGDFQRFLKRLRKAVFPVRVRFFACGEYGEECLNCQKAKRDCCCGRWVPTTGRPHFHAAVFGYAFRGDRVPFKKTGGGFMVDRSAQLERLWPLGFSSVGELTFESAAYIARYVTKKVTGDKAEGHYRRVDSETGEVRWLQPEFVHMSLKPGIGAEWFKKFGSEVYPLDRVIARGVPSKPPKFYDVLFGRTAGDELELVKAGRVERAKARGDNSDDRLRVKEVVATARAKFYRRELK